MAVYVHQNQLGEVRTGVVAGTLNTNSNASGRNAPLVFDARGNSDGKTALVFENHGQDSRITGPLDVFPTVSAKFGTGGNNTPLIMATGQADAEIMLDACPTLNCNSEQPIVAANAGGAEGQTMSAGIVRRLTPLECERLQGLC